MKNGIPRDDEGYDLLIKREVAVSFPDHGLRQAALSISFGAPIRRAPLTAAMNTASLIFLPE
jgi:hypothetical protein